METAFHDKIAAEPAKTREKRTPNIKERFMFERCGDLEGPFSSYLWNSISKTGLDTHLPAILWRWGLDRFEMCYVLG